MQGKIINDPVYGFLRFPEWELMQIIDHPWFQRLRHIRQMGLAYLVYPGATHSRFHHSLGACHLMHIALEELKLKGVVLTKEECTAARIAILLHDIGHGPFSHALENSLVTDITHEELSGLIMQQFNKKFDNALASAIAIFDHEFPKKYLHQLVSSQLDVDRMDYLNRDSFYTGVSEGVISYDRIIQMLTVKNGELMVEEKAVHSVEKFIIARRLMYWQVYLHKTVLGAEQLLVNILKRAKELAMNGKELFTTPALKYFLYNQVGRKEFESNEECIGMFCSLDDHDIMTAIKMWQASDDQVLSMLCRMLIERRLYKVQLSGSSLDELYEQKRKLVLQSLNIPDEHLDYFVFSGKTSTSTYDVNDEKICIALKNGDIRDISEMENALVNQALARPVHKNYICWLQPQ